MYPDVDLLVDTLVDKSELGFYFLRMELFSLSLVFIFVAVNDTSFLVDGRQETNTSRSNNEKNTVRILLGMKSELIILTPESSSACLILGKMLDLFMLVSLPQTGNDGLPTCDILIFQC